MAPKQVKAYTFLQQILFSDLNFLVHLRRLFITIFYFIIKFQGADIRLNLFGKERKIVNHQEKQGKWKYEKATYKIKTGK